jgi:hypothetical protein
MFDFSQAAFIEKATDRGIKPYSYTILAAQIFLECDIYCSAA